MQYSAVLPFLVVYLNTVYAGSNQDSPFSIGDVSIDGLKEHSNLDDNSSNSAPWENNKGKKLLSRIHESQQWQWRDSRTKPYDVETKGPVWEPLASNKHTALSGLRSSRLPIGINSRSSMLQEDSVRLHARSPTRSQARDSTPSQDSKESKSVSPPQSQQRRSSSNPPQQRTGLLSNALQQQRTNGRTNLQPQQLQPSPRRRVHVLQPLTDETTHATESLHGFSSRADSRRASEIFSQSVTRQQQQQQLQPRLQQPSSHLEYPQNNGGRSIAFPLNSSISPASPSRIRNGAQTPSSSSKRSSSQSRDENSGHRSADPDFTNHNLVVQSRSTSQGTRSRYTSPTQPIPRRRRREDHDETTSSTVALGRFNEGQNDSVATDALTRTSSEEGEPPTQRRRLSKRGNITTKMSQRRKLPPQLAKKIAEGENSGPELQSSMSVSSSGGSLRTSKSQRKKAAKAAKAAKGAKGAASSSSDLTNQGASSSQTPEQGTKGRKSRQKPTSQQPTSPASHRGTAYLYGRPKPNRQQQLKDPTLDRVLSQESPSRSSSPASFGTAVSRSSNKNPAPKSPSGSSVKSFFSAKSDTSVSPVRPPRSSFASAEPASPPARHTRIDSPRVGVSFADQPSPRTGGVGTGSRASSATSFSTQLSRGFLMPISPFTNSRPANTQSLPGSPSTHYRPLFFGSAHSRAYSAPELTTESPARPPLPASAAGSSALPLRESSSGPPSPPSSNAQSQGSPPLGQSSASSDRVPTPRQNSPDSRRVSTSTQDPASPEQVPPRRLPPRPSPPDSPSTPKAQIQRQGAVDNLPASPQGQQGSNIAGGLDPVIAQPRVSKYGPVGSPVRGGLAADKSKSPSQLPKIQ